MLRHRGAAWLLLAACTHVRSLTAPQFYDSATKAPAFYKLVARDGTKVFASKPRPQPLVVGVAGGTASGKTALTANIVELLGAEAASVASITQDSFYRDLTSEEMARIEEINFDVPEAFDFEEIEAVLTALKRGDTSVRVPTYDFVANARRPPSNDIILEDSPRVVFFEGILALHSARLRDLMDLKIFVDADADVRLARRIRRDVAERGRDVDGVLRAYEQFVKPAFDEFVLPTKRHADVVVPRGAENAVAIDLLVRGIRERTLERSAEAASSRSPRVIVAP